MPAGAGPQARGQRPPRPGQQPRLQADPRAWLAVHGTRTGHAWSGRPCRPVVISSSRTEPFLEPGTRAGGFLPVPSRSAALLSMHGDHIVTAPGDGVPGRRTAHTNFSISLAAARAHAPPLPWRGLPFLHLPPPPPPRAPLTPSVLCEAGERPYRSPL